jgi:hypothetical protein
MAREHGIEHFSSAPLMAASDAIYFIAGWGRQDATSDGEVTFRKYYAIRSALHPKRTFW